MKKVKDFVNFRRSLHLPFEDLATLARLSDQCDHLAHRRLVRDRPLMTGDAAALIHFHRAQSVVADERRSSAQFTVDGDGFIARKSAIWINLMIAVRQSRIKLTDFFTGSQDRPAGVSGIFQQLHSLELVFQKFQLIPGFGQSVRVLATLQCCHLSNQNVKVVGVETENGRDTLELDSFNSFSSCSSLASVWLMCCSMEMIYDLISTFLLNWILFK